MVLINKEETIKKAVQGYLLGETNVKVLVKMNKEVRDILADYNSDSYLDLSTIKEGSYNYVYINNNKYLFGGKKYFIKTNKTDIGILKDDIYHNFGFSRLRDKVEYKEIDGIIENILKLYKWEPAIILEMDEEKDTGVTGIYILNEVD